MMMTYNTNMLRIPYRMNNTPSTYKQQILKQSLSKTRDKIIWNSTNDYLICIHTKYYSVIRCITHNTTNFSYQNINRIPISRKSNYRTNWLLKNFGTETWSAGRWLTLSTWQHSASGRASATAVFASFIHLKDKVEVKFTPEQATKAQRRSRCTSLLFLQPRR